MARAEVFISAGKEKTKREKAPNQRRNPGKKDQRQKIFVKLLQEIVSKLACS